MSQNIYALGTYELELLTHIERNELFNLSKSYVDYIDTAIDYNNDYLFNNNLYKKYKIISKISFCHYSNYEFFVSNHLKCLNRDYIDIMLIHSNRGNWKQLALKMQTDIRFKEIGVSNFTKKDIEEYKELTGVYPSYNEVEINPYYTDVETIEFCKVNGIKIIAYAIFGGKYNAIRNIADFSLPYLLSYANSYADITIIRPDSIRHIYELLDCIMNNADILPINTIHVDYNTKSIEPMLYKVPPVRKYLLGTYTYHNACGMVQASAKTKSRSLDMYLPEFEMLGDYKVFLRYKLRSKYNENEDIYFHYT